jgi:trimeric autotransporter adhesin
MLGNSHGQDEEDGSETSNFQTALLRSLEPSPSHTSNSCQPFSARHSSTSSSSSSSSSSSYAPSSSSNQRPPQSSMSDLPLRREIKSHPSAQHMTAEAVTVIDGSDDDDVAWESDSCGGDENFDDDGGDRPADEDHASTFDVEADVKLLSDLNDFEPSSPSGRTAATTDLRGTRGSPPGRKGSSDIDRVVDTASRMADWAKHAVRRAFRDHAQTTTTQTPHTAAPTAALTQAAQSLGSPMLPPLPPPPLPQLAVSDVLASSAPSFASASLSISARKESTAHSPSVTVPTGINIKHKTPMPLESIVKNQSSVIASSETAIQKPSRSVTFNIAAKSEMQSNGEGRDTTVSKQSTTSASSSSVMPPRNLPISAEVAPVRSQVTATVGFAEMIEDSFRDDMNTREGEDECMRQRSSSSSTASSSSSSSFSSFSSSSSAASASTLSSTSLPSISAYSSLQGFNPNNMSSTSMTNHASVPISAPTLSSSLELATSTKERAQNEVLNTSEDLIEDMQHDNALTQADKDSTDRTDIAESLKISQDESQELRNDLPPTPIDEIHVVDLHIPSDVLADEEDDATLRGATDLTLYDENEVVVLDAKMDLSDDVSMSRRMEQGEPHGDQLKSMLRLEESEEKSARKVRNAAARDAESMTEEMREEVIALLNAFGLPYVIAPYEAEAQCAGATHTLPYLSLSLCLYSSLACVSCVF